MKRKVLIAKSTKANNGYLTNALMYHALLYVTKGSFPLQAWNGVFLSVEKSKNINKAMNASFKALSGNGPQHFNTRNPNGSFLTHL